MVKEKHLQITNMNNETVFPYEWELGNTTFTKDKGTVFSCFACGGGSTMGYKLAGYDVIGCNEIDGKMISTYIANHAPRFPFHEKIQTFKDRAEFPEELYNLSILDGSPPCSTFSISGDREKDWGKERVFTEGGEKQILDTLFFDFIYLAKRLQPKVVVAENVKGLMLGNAVKYVIDIYREFDAAGYKCQHFILNGKNMGLPQKRERVFFIALRKDLCDPFDQQVDMFTINPKINMDFNCEEINFGSIYRNENKEKDFLTAQFLELWNLRKHGDVDLCNAWQRKNNTERKRWFSFNLIYNDNVANTVMSKSKNILFEEPRFMNDTEIKLASSFPMDYNFNGNEVQYLTGMSVPPVMIAQISKRIYEQWLSKIN